MRRGLFPNILQNMLKKSTKLAKSSVYFSIEKLIILPLPFFWLLHNGQKIEKYYAIAKTRKNSAIRNCCISARGAIKLHPFVTSAEQTKECMPKKINCRSIFDTIFEKTVDLFIFALFSDFGTLCFTRSSDEVR